MTTDDGTSIPAAQESVTQRTNVEKRVADRSYSDVGFDVENRRRDPVRWGSIWAGLLVAMAMFILLELIFFSFGWLTFEEGAGTTAGWVTALIGIVAFFIGGTIAGGSSIWTSAREGAVHGMLVWALGVVGILFLALFGGGALFGSASTVFVELGSMQQANISDADVTQALEAARDSAGWAVLGLLVYLIAAAVGGVCGVKMGSGHKQSAADKTR